MFAQLRDCACLELAIEGPEPPRTPTAPRLERGAADPARPGPPQAQREEEPQPEADEILQHLALFADASRKAQAAAEQEDPLWSSDWTDVAGAMRRQPSQSLPA